MSRTRHGIVIAFGIVATAAVLGTDPQRVGGGDALLPAAPSVLSYAAPERPGPIDLELRRDGARLALLDAGEVVASRELAATSAVSIGGPDRRDTSLTVDYAGGAIPIPIDYRPGELGPETLNLLTIRGGAFSRETHTAHGPHSGVIALDGVPIAYANLTPIIDTVPVLNFGILTGEDSETISVVDGPISGGFQTTQVSNTSGTFETMSFANKTNVTVRCRGGSDSVTVHTPNPAAGLATLAVDGGGGDDTLTVQGHSGAMDVLRVTGLGPSAGSVVRDNSALWIPLAFLATEHLGIALEGDAGDEVRLDGTAGNDAFVCTQSPSLDGGSFTGTMDQNNATGLGPFALVPVTFAGVTPAPGDWDLNYFVPGGTDTFEFDASAFADTIHLGNGEASGVQVDNTVAATMVARLELFNIASVALRGDAGDDHFDVTPRAGVPVDVVGGAPAPPSSPGDVLAVDPAGTTAPMLSSALVAGVGYAGSFTFGDRGTVTFSQLEGLAPAVDLGVTKTDAQATDMPGTGTAYTVVVSHNSGTVGIAGVGVADAFPAALTGVAYTASATGGAAGFTAAGSGDIADTLALPVGSTVTYLVTAGIASSATGTLANTASLAIPAGVADTEPLDDSATDITDLVPSADLSAAKTGPAAVQAGYDLAYALAAANAGPSDALAVTLSDPLPAGTTFVSLAQTAGPSFACTTPAVGGTGTVTCSIAAFPAGASADFTLAVHVPADTENATVLENAATIASETADPNAGNDASATVQTQVAGFVPTLGAAGMALLALLLAAAGAVALRLR